MFKITQQDIRQTVVFQWEIGVAVTKTCLRQTDLGQTIGDKGSLRLTAKPVFLYTTRMQI